MIFRSHLSLQRFLALPRLPARPQLRARPGSLALLALLALLPLPGRRAGAQEPRTDDTLVVAADGSGDYTTLSAAVAAARPGSRLLVRSGVYAEQVLLDRPLVLEAEGGRPQIVGAPRQDPASEPSAMPATSAPETSQPVGSAPAAPIIVDLAALVAPLPPGSSVDRLPDALEQATLIVDAPCVLRSFVLQADSGPAVWLRDGSLELERCAISTVQQEGVVVDGAHALTLRDSAVTCFGATGVHLTAGAQALLVNSEVVRCAIGVALDGATLEMQDSRISRCPRGLRLIRGARASVSGSTVWACAATGLELHAGSELEARDLTVKAPGGAPALHLVSGARARLRDCSVVGTPAEVDHHPGPSTRDHVATEIRSGTDHHILTGLISVQDGSHLEMQGGSIRRSLGHGLYMNRATAVLSDTQLTDAVFYNVFLENESRPEFVRCTVADAGENGVFAWDEAAGSFEQCQIVGNGTFTQDKNRWAQVVLADGARTRFVDTVIRDGAAVGVVVSGGTTRGRFERCTIANHGTVGVSVSAGAQPLLLNCRVTGNGEHGLWATRGGAGWMSGGQLAGNGKHGLHVDHGAYPTLQQVTIQSNGATGVTTWRGGRPTLVECEITANVQQGVVTAYGGDAVLRGCRVHDNERGKSEVKAPGSPR